MTVTSISQSSNYSEISQSNDSAISQSNYRVPRTLPNHRTTDIEFACACRCFSLWGAGSNLAILDNHCEEADGPVAMHAMYTNFPGTNVTAPGNIQMWCGPIAVDGNSYSNPGYCASNNCQANDDGRICWSAGSWPTNGTIGTDAGCNKTVLPSHFRELLWKGFPSVAFPRVAKESDEMQRRRLQGNEPGFPAGWNDEAISPPMLWRHRSFCMRSDLPGESSCCPGLSAGPGSCSTLDASIGGGISVSRGCPSCGSWAAAIDALTSKTWAVPSRGAGKFSLADVGYTGLELDEGWEDNVASKREQHAVVNAKSYPNMSALVEYGHTNGLKMSLSINNGATQNCSDANMQGDVRNLQELGFDGVRLYGLGPCLNNTRYAELMRASGSNFTVANDHWFQGDTVEPIGCHRTGSHVGQSGREVPTDASSCPTEDWCPFNTYQMAADTVQSPDSWYKNLQMMVPFTALGKPLSRPGCWAFPGNLQVGNIMDPGNKTALDMPWNRAHFAAFCIVSSPLVLAMDFGLAATHEIIEAVLPIIANKFSIEINQQWAGSPGRLLMSLDPDNPDGQPDAAGFQKLIGALGPGHDMRRSNSTTVVDAEAWCKAQPTCEGFTFDNKRTPPEMLFKDGMGGSTNNFTGNVVNRDPAWTTYLKYEYIGASALAQQVWGKPLPNNTWAVLAINGAPSREFDASLPLHMLNITGAVEVHDVWTDQPVPGLSSVTGSFVIPSVPPRDSGFYKLRLKSDDMHMAATVPLANGRFCATVGITDNDPFAKPGVIHFKLCLDSSDLKSGKVWQVDATGVTTIWDDMSYTTTLLPNGSCTAYSADTNMFKKTFFGSPNVLAVHPDATLLGTNGSNQTWIHMNHIDWEGSNHTCTGFNSGQKETTRWIRLWYTW